VHQRQEEEVMKRSSDWLKWGLLVLAATVFVGGSQVVQATVVTNGDMEPASYTVCPGWTYYSGGTITTALQSRETVIIHGGLAAQKLAGNAGNAAANFGIRQTIEASIGDAFTFGGWVWNNSAATYQETSIRAAWDGGTTAGTAAVLSISTSTKQVWQQLALAGGNATSTGVTVFLHTRRTNNNGSILTYWDDVTGYRAYVPPALTVGAATDNSLVVDVNPGGNADNSSAQFAVGIAGGTSGWVQADGSVGASAVWRTDAQWAATIVTGLAPSTAYDFQVQARYSSTIAQPTVLANAGIATGETTPEPATLLLLVLGGAPLLARRR
jgi:hypothetical protein